jgi:serine/threonine-protein kinase RsbW
VEAADWADLISHMESAKQAIRLPSAVTEIRHVQAAVQQAMKHFGYDGDDCFAVRLALEESLINAIKHGNRFDPQRSVHVRFDVSPRRVRISVRDEGRGFDPAVVPDPTAEENLTKPNGRGIMLMRTYMDEIRFTARGREVIMVKKRR